MLFCDFGRCLARLVEGLSLREASNGFGVNCFVSSRDDTLGMMDPSWHIHYSAPSLGCILIRGNDLFSRSVNLTRVSRIARVTQVWSISDKYVIFIFVFICGGVGLDVGWGWRGGNEWMNEWIKELVNVKFHGSARSLSLSLCVCVRACVRVCVFNAITHCYRCLWDAWFLNKGFNLIL